MSKPILLYTFERSVWASVPELAIRELGYGPNDIQKIVVNLRCGDNFKPTFLDINPKGTLPTMTVGDQVYTSTAEVTSYLVKHAPKQVTPGTSFIAKLHEDKYDPNFPILLARSDEELRRKGEHFARDFIENRHGALQSYSAQSGATQHGAFYASKMGDTAQLLSVYKGALADEHKQAFFQRSTLHWKNLKEFISKGLPELMHDTTFLGGNEPGEDDMHLAAWLARIAFVAGGGQEQDGVRALEKGFGIEVHPKIAAYWGEWSIRKSWQEVYGAGLH